MPRLSSSGAPTTTGARRGVVAAQRDGVAECVLRARRCRQARPQPPRRRGCPGLEDVGGAGGLAPDRGERRADRQQPAVGATPAGRARRRPSAGSRRETPTAELRTVRRRIGKEFLHLPHAAARRDAAGAVAGQAVTRAPPPDAAARRHRGTDSVAVRPRAIGSAARALNRPTVVGQRP